MVPPLADQVPDLVESALSSGPESPGGREAPVVHVGPPRAFRAGARSDARPPHVGHGSTDVSELWRRYHETGSERALSDLIARHQPLVKFVAARLLPDIPKSVPLETLIAYGVSGLTDAITRYEPDRGIRFESFAVPRIRGSIIDEIRSIDWTPRSVRSKTRLLADAHEELLGSLRRSPTPAELADHVGLSRKEMDDLSILSERSRVADLDQTAHNHITDVSSDPAVILEGREEVKALRSALLRLHSRERQVIELYYFGELTLSQIARVLGVTEGRVSQIRSRAVSNLLSRLTREEGLRSPA